MKHVMNLNPEPFDMIESGEKTIELRLCDEKRRKLRTGDVIEFVRPDGKRLCAGVIALHRFSSFEELYRSLPLLSCGYTAENIDKASPSDMEEYYSAERQKQYGVLGIEIKVIKETEHGI